MMRIGLKHRNLMSPMREGPSYLSDYGVDAARRGRFHVVNQEEVHFLHRRYVIKQRFVFVKDTIPRVLAFRPVEPAVSHGSVRFRLVLN